MSWSIDNLARAFRELYSTLNWHKVFESFGEITDQEIPSQALEQGLDVKQFQTLMQLFNRSKPQNIMFPLQSLLSQQWKSSSLQLTLTPNLNISSLMIQAQRHHRADLPIANILFIPIKNFWLSFRPLSSPTELTLPSAVPAAATSDARIGAL